MLKPRIGFALRWVPQMGKWTGWASQKSSFANKISLFPGSFSNMKALVLQKPGIASIQAIPEPVVRERSILLKVRMVGLCGRDLNSFRGLYPLVSFTRITAHEVSATVVQGHINLPCGTDVAL